MRTRLHDQLRPGPHLLSHLHDHEHGRAHDLHRAHADAIVVRRVRLRMDQRLDRPMLGLLTGSMAPCSSLLLSVLLSRARLAGRSSLVRPGFFARFTERGP